MTSRQLGLVILVGLVGIAVGLAIASLTDVESLWQPTGDRTADGPQPDQETPMPEWSDYEGKIQRPLFDLATADDPDAFATTEDLDAARMVRVVIQLADDAAELPSGYTVVVEAEGITGIQAWVPLDQLLDLAQESSVAYIRPPQEPTLH